MGKLPTLKPREVVALLGALGFAEVRQKGSHKQFRHADGRGTTVPFHSGRDISPTLLRKIAKDIGLTSEQLLGRGDEAAEQGDEADEAVMGKMTDASLATDRLVSVRAEDAGLVPSVAQRPTSTTTERGPTA